MAYDPANQSAGLSMPMQQNFVNAIGYADGGAIGGGAPGLSTPGQSGPMDPQMMDAHISDGLRKNPEVEQQITQMIQEALNSGELTMPELQQLFQLAKAAAHSPAIWPQLRQFCIQQGIADPQDLPEQFDQGLVSVVLIVAKVAEKMLNAPQSPAAGIRPPQGMGDGLQSQGPGMIQGPGTGTSDSIPAQNLANGGQVNVSTGEYVIPADVVKAKGVDFFDAMVRKYHQPAGFKG